MSIGAESQQGHFVAVDDQHLTIPQRPVRLSAGLVVSGNGIAACRLWVRGGSDMRDERAIEETQPVRDRLGNGIEIDDASQCSEIGAKYARSRAVSAVNHDISLQQIDQPGVGTGIGQGSSEHKDIAAPNPDDVEVGEPIHRARLPQVEQCHLEPGGLELVNVTAQPDDSILGRYVLDGVRNERGSPTTAREPAQPFVMRPESE